MGKVIILIVFIILIFTIANKAFDMSPESFSKNGTRSNDEENRNYVLHPSDCDFNEIWSFFRFSSDYTPQSLKNVNKDSRKWNYIKQQYDGIDNKSHYIVPINGF